MAIDWSLSVISLCFFAGLMALARFGLLDGLARRPALLMMVALGAGVLYRAAGFPAVDPALISYLGDAGLAALVFAATLQFRVSKLRAQSPAAMRLAVIGGPVFLALTALTALVLMPSMTFWPALLMGGALMLNGAAIDRKTILAAPVTTQLKETVSLESAVALALGLPFVILLEAVATAPYVMGPALFDTKVFGFAIGFALGGGVSLAGAWLMRQMGLASQAIPAALVSCLVACLAAFIFGGDPVIAAAAAGFVWSEEVPMKRKRRIRLRQLVDTPVMPVAYAGFGFLLGHRILEADTLVIFFALSTITLLRLVPRMVALQKLKLPREEQSFLAWFGGAPGAASALYLMSLVGSSAVLDQEALLNIGTAVIMIGILATRLSSRPMAQYFVRQAIIARKRRFYSTG